MSISPKTPAETNHEPCSILEFEKFIKTIEFNPDPTPNLSPLIEARLVVLRPEKDTETKKTIDRGNKIAGDSYDLELLKPNEAINLALLENLEPEEIIKSLSTEERLMFRFSEVGFLQGLNLQRLRLAIKDQQNKQIEAIRSRQREELTASIEKYLQDKQAVIDRYEEIRTARRVKARRTKRWISVEEGRIIREQEEEEIDQELKALRAKYGITFDQVLDYTIMLNKQKLLGRYMKEASQILTDYREMIGLAIEASYKRDGVFPVLNNYRLQKEIEGLKEQMMVEIKELRAGYWNLTDEEMDSAVDINL